MRILLAKFQVPTTPGNTVCKKYLWRHHDVISTKFGPWKRNPRKVKILLAKFQVPTTPGSAFSKVPMTSSWRHQYQIWSTNFNPHKVTILLAKFQVRLQQKVPFLKSTYDVTMTSLAPNLIHEILILTRW